MPIHHHNHQIEQALRVERNRQILGCALFSFGSVVLIMGILSLFFLTTEPQITAELTAVTYKKEHKDDKPEKKQPKEAVPKKPSAPTSHVSKFIYSRAVSHLSVPVQEIDVELPSVDLGESLDFGQGSGNGFSGGGSNGNGNGHGANVVSYNDASSSVRRVAYVFDCSSSMGHREGLMRNELSRSLAELGENMHYQLIPFVSEPWQPDSVLHRVTEKPPGWLKASDAQKKESLAHIRETSLSAWHPIWRSGIDIALQMDPKPNVIIFITDGAYAMQTRDSAGWIGNKAMSQGTIINTLAVKLPPTKRAMYTLSDVSGGTYVRINPNGTRYDYHGKRIKSDPRPLKFIQTGP